MTALRISAKNLGYLALPDFCPRCFWLKMKAANGLPFQIFPGIFSSIDSYTKKITNCHFEKSASLPGWFSGFNGLLRPVAVPHHSEFYVIDPATGIRLTGVPDEIFQRLDRSFFIADYKTAKFTENQDSLMPIYRVQLNTYAYLGNRCGFKPVTGIGLVYYEPQTDLTMGLVDSVVNQNGFMMPFRGKLLELELKPEAMIPPLLREVRRLCDCQKAPIRRDGCEDCERMDDLVGLLAR